MPIPTYDALMLPVLELCAEKPWFMRDMVARVAEDLRLDQLEREKMIPSGAMPLIANRIHWAKTYLKQAGLVELPKRSYVQITQRGREVLARNLSKNRHGATSRFEEFRKFQSRTRSADALPAAVALPVAAPAPIVDAADITSTPEEQIASASLTLNELLRDALLTRVLAIRPSLKG